MSKVAVIIICLAAIGTLVAAVAPAAAAPAPGWSINTIPEPTTFNRGDTGEAIDQIRVTATAGTYELHFHLGALAGTTVPIAWNASASEVEAALRSFPGVGQGNVSVTGGPGDATGSVPYTVTWDGRLSGRPVGELEEREVNLADGGGEGTVIIERTHAPHARDRYLVVVTNTGDAPSSGEIVIHDAMGQELVPVALSVEEPQSRNSDECSLAEMSCTYHETLQPGHQLWVSIVVALPDNAAPGMVSNEVMVSGGGAAPAAASVATPVTVDVTTPQFGISGFNVDVLNDDGSRDEQAANHPFSMITTLDLKTRLATASEESTKHYAVVEEPKDVAVELPLGVVGDPLAAARCPAVDLTDRIGTAAAACPRASQVGVVSLVWEGGLSSAPIALYNVVPEKGYPAELGLSTLGLTSFLYATVVPSTSGYRLRITAPGTLRGVAIEDISVTIFGSPGERDGVGGMQAFITNPTSCSTQPLTAVAEATAWEGGSARAETVAYPQLTDCNLLQGAAAFDPSIAVEPETTQADTPSGYVVDLRLPQGSNAFGTLATPDLKDAVITLPAGVAISPSAASGPSALSGCMLEQISLLGTEVGEGHPGSGRYEDSPYDDGLVHAAPGHCPENSRLGEVEVKTPVLAEPLHGHLYLAEPKCGQVGQAVCTEEQAEKGEVFGVYLEVVGSGVIVKQAGIVEVGGHGAHSVAAGLAPGQVRVRFDEAPQFPLEEVKVTFPGGQRTPLANPQECGTATTTSELEPWSAPASGPNATPFSSFAVTGCEGAMPFTPGFTAGMASPTAGGYSPFLLHVSRRDGEQDLSGLETTLPQGLLAKLAGVPECGEAEANAGTCSEASRIGTVTVTAGAGSEPLEETGRIYLTGPYNGGPFGEVVVVPAVAGPFNLGNVVVRGAIRIDLRTTQATVASNPFPTIVDGVPVRVRTIDVEVNRPGFTFNPTDCDSLAVTAMLTAAQGASAAASSPFTVTDCAALAFKPKFAVSTSGHTSRVGGASLDTTVTYPSTPQGTEANIAKVKVSLPAKLPARLTTLQKACPEQTFAAHPASCPAASVVGEATAKTSVLPTPLGGPAYFVSHGGAKYPELVIELKGDNVTIDLHGETAISKKGVLTSTFNTVPDAPFSSFELKLPMGRYSVLTANGANLCRAGKLIMPTELVAQDGAAIHQKTTLEVTGCPKARHRTSRKGGRRK